MSRNILRRHGHTVDREAFRSPPAGAADLEKNISETRSEFIRSPRGSASAWRSGPRRTLRASH